MELNRPCSKFVKEHWDNCVLYLKGTITIKELEERNKLINATVVNKEMSIEEIPEPELPEGVFRPSHYKDAPFDIMLIIGYVLENLRKGIRDNLWNNHNFDDPSHEQACRWAVGVALKHLLRLGLKDPVDIELKKAENYIHYARTGEWINDN